MTFNTSPGLVVSTPAGGSGGMPALPVGFLAGLQMFKTGDTTLTVRAGLTRDDANTFDLLLAADTVVDFSAVGLNGADAVIGNAHRIIYAWLVGGAGQPTGVQISESAVAPTFLPSYTAAAFIGSIPIDAGEGPFQVDWMQSGNGRSRMVRLGPQDLQEALVGGPWMTGPGQIPAVTASSSWRNIVAGGVDTNFDPSERMPARPEGAGGNNAQRGIRGIFQIATRQNANDFIEFAPAHGALEAPTSSPLNGDGNERVYNIATNQNIELPLQVGDNQTLQYRSTAGNGTYLIAVVGWIDELGLG